MLDLGRLPVDMLEWTRMVYSDAPSGLTMNVVSSFCRTEGPVCTIGVVDYDVDKYKLLKAHAGRIAMYLANTRMNELIEALSYDPTSEVVTKFEVKFFGDINGKIDSSFDRLQNKTHLDSRMGGTIHAVEDGALEALCDMSACQAYSYIYADRMTGSPERLGLMKIFQETLDRHNVKVFSISNALHVVLLRLPSRGMHEGRVHCIVLDREGRILYHQNVITVNKDRNDGPIASVCELDLPGSVKMYLSTIRTDAFEFTMTLRLILMAYLLDEGISSIRPVPLSPGIHKTHVAKIEYVDNQNAILVTHKDQPAIRYAVRDPDLLRSLKSRAPKKSE